MSADVVAELDEWLERETTTLKHYPADDVDTGLLQRARDEIVALRERDKPTWDPDRDEIVRLRAALERHDRLVADAVAVRAVALEEAARACDLLIGAHGSVDWVNACMSCIAAIRVLKEGRDD